jgi:CRISP-associated protein Cas1
MSSESGFFRDTVGAALRRALTRSQLLAAWGKVAGNRGMAGVDGVSVEDFAVNVQSRLDELRHSVLAGRYAAQPYLRLWLPRPGKAPRALAVPCVVDRVLQTAWALALMPLFEAEFEDCSFAYRQGRGVRQAVARIEALQREGYRWVVDADIEAFFDQIPHAPLLKAVSELVPHDPSALALLAHWLAVPVQDGAALQVPERGVPQGLPVSPMLANLYLDHLDEALLHEDLALVRYADDFVILTKSRAHADAALELTKQTLAQLQLRLNDHKTRIVHLDDGLEFLGWQFVRSMAVPRAPGQADSPREASYLTPAAAVAPVAGPGPLPERPAPEVPAPEATAAPLPEQLPAASLSLPAPATWDDAQQATEADTATFAPEDDDTAPPASQPPADALQRTLYVVEPGCELAKESERLVLRKGDSVLLEVPVLHVDQVVVFGQHPITAAALHLCLQRGVPVVLLSRLGRFVGRIDAEAGRHVRLLQAQVRAADKPELCLALAAQSVSAKLANSALVLARFARHRGLAPPLAQALGQAVVQLRRDRQRVKTAQTLDVLRGLEGQAARVYFARMRSLLGDAWGFTARQKQPPPDPVNAMLSLGYTLLYHSVAGLLQARGLNAHLGFLHAAGGEHMALASDVMEEFRSVVVDALVLDWCLNGKVSPADFSTSPDGCALSADATRRFIRAYEERLGTGSHWAWPGDDKGADLRRRVDWQAMRLAQALHAQDASLYLQSSYR